MSETLVLGSGNQYPEAYETESIFEIGNGSGVYEHTGYLIDSSMSVTHVDPNISYGVKTNIEMIKGWKVVGQAKYNEKDYTDGIVIYIDKNDYDAEHSALVSPFTSLVLIDTYQSVWENQIVVDDGISTAITTIGGKQGYEMRISFNPPLVRGLDKVTGIYLANHKTAGPSILYGEYSVISGHQPIRSIGNCAWSLGHATLAQGTYSLAHGEHSVAYGHAAHAEGFSSAAAGNYSHADGYSCAAIGKASYAQGFQTQAIGNYSYAGGYQTKAIGEGSVTLGNNTIAKKPYCVAVGQYNTGDCTDAYFEIGIGTKTQRKTGFYMDKSGLAYLPYATIANIQAASNNKAIVTKEYIQPLQNRLSDSSDYIIERGRLATTVKYTPNAQDETESKMYTTSIEGIGVYYEKWASGRSVCRFDTPMLYFANMPSVNHDTNSRFILAKVELPLCPDGTHIFEYHRYPALVTSPHWLFDRVYEHSLIVNDTVCSAPVDYIELEAWRKANDTTTAVNAFFFVELHGFWKNFMEYGNTLTWHEEDNKK